VSQRATHRLIHQLDLVDAGEPLGDEVMQKFIEMFQDPLAPKAIVVLRAVTRLANNQATEAMAALDEGELATQVDAHVT
jgi:cyclopropane fatty-acyl-phospholipid synthase-like methyltransferase